jgi:quercetin dioxygenase-like cupin family protein
MIKKNYQEVENKGATLTDGTPVKDVYVRWLIDNNDGAKNFAMRMFEIKAHTKVPLHSHWQDHEIYILEGKGRFFNDVGNSHMVHSGDILYIPPNEKHGIENLDEEVLRFLCLIPYPRE